MIGVSPSIISAYETGERAPGTEAPLALSYLYRCSADYSLFSRIFNNCRAVTTKGALGKCLVLPVTR